jgi:hypothetical protein
VRRSSVIDNSKSGYTRGILKFGEKCIKHFEQRGKTRSSSLPKKAIPSC